MLNENSNYGNTLTKVHAHMLDAMSITIICYNLAIMISDDKRTNKSFWLSIKGLKVYGYGELTIKPF